MKVVLLQVGKTDREYIKKGVDDFETRVSRLTQFETITVPDLKNRKSLSPDEQRKREAEKIRDHFNNGDLIILLDEKGETFTSIGFSGLLKNLFSSSHKRILFVIGGPYGFHQDIYQMSHRLISLSSMTFSHQMVRLLFVEQLYRAITILKGHPYHNE